MDDENVCGTGDQGGEISPRPPENSDLVDLCRQLHEAGAAYVVIGGFAIVQSRRWGRVELPNMGLSGSQMRLSWT